MKRLLILFTSIISFLLFYSCTCNRADDKKNLKELKDTTVKISIDRYEKALFNLNKNDLQNELKKIKPQYSFFLDGDLEDKNNIAQLNDYLNDPQMIENYKACQKEFSDLSQLEKQLSSALTYFKFYFPDKKIPKVYTYVCGMDFENPVIYADSLLLIALDMYLGADYPLYTGLGLPMFMRRTMNKDFIVRDCMKAMAEFYLYTDMKDAACLDFMVYEGKKQYFIDAMMPAVSDTIKFKYTKNQLDWCNENESKIWAYFIDNKLLYSKDDNAFRKFFTDGPFTTPFSKSSPPRTGSWLGWRIVTEYMKRDKNISFKKLFENTNAQQILTQSNYKPQKP